MGKNILIISSAPHSWSFSHKISNSYKKWAEKMWNSVKIIDLYDEKYAQKFLKFENMREMPKDKIKDLIQEKMTKADEYIFVFPIWWWWVPAIMKNFFDTNLSSGFAFQFWKNWMEKLLSNKTAKVFCTSDAPWWIYKIPFVSWILMKSFFKVCILWFCGIKLKSFELFWNMRGKSENKKIEILEKIENWDF